MRYILFLLIPIYLFAKTSFITQMEYSSSLYKNPRGIGCHLCHGDIGQGHLVASYVDKKVKKEFRGPAINNIDFSKFYRALNVRKRGMPRYFLTDREVKALYFYLQEKQKKSSSDEK